MRNFREPTAKNLLREPLVLGVPFIVLVGMTLLTLVGLIAFGDSSRGGMLVSIAVGCFYLTARILQLFARTGWTETLVFFFERSALQKVAQGRPEICLADDSLEIIPVDTLENDDLIAHKLPVQEIASRIRPEERFTCLTEKTLGGVKNTVYVTKRSGELKSLAQGLLPNLKGWPFIYSLYNLPTVTTPLWLYETLSSGEAEYLIISSFRGLKAHRIKEQIETARRRNARISRISNVDSDVAFGEATQVLEGLARGDDSVVEGSVLILSKQKLDLDSRYFCLEKKTELPLFSITGLRHRLHRAHLLRAATASDLILNFGDPLEADGTAILKTLRGLPLYFNPQDSRLEALHWLVIAASGAGKSFFVGLVLLRLVEAGNQISVLFIDHNRSFRRVTRAANRGTYLEPDTFEKLTGDLQPFIASLNTPGTIAGLELSDFANNEKRGAIRILLTEIESWLRARNTIHPVYLVLDECWNFMREEPLLVQRAFREFRKLNGAAIAITQSLSDFLMDESGRAIFQNAPIRILLRQAEDLEPYRGVLGLNDVELKRLRSLRQKKGEFSECLIKTPFLTRIGRLYPTPAEHALLRTDNIREELVRENAKATLKPLITEAQC